MFEILAPLFLVLVIGVVLGVCALLAIQDTRALKAYRAIKIIRDSRDDPASKFFSKFTGDNANGS